MALELALIVTLAVAVAGGNGVAMGLDVAIRVGAINKTAWA